MEEEGNYTSISLYVNSGRGDSAMSACKDNSTRAVGEGQREKQGVSQVSGRFAEFLAMEIVYVKAWN